MNAGIVSGVVTALLLLTFIGGWAWAWSDRRREEFRRASMLPLEGDGTEGQR